ncbi:MAG: nucleotidyltransferase domain-containing protein [Clostridiaceae bacterium]|jgi:predicted nucleotidyltransferase|nr:nucleotidyltransferase domain-containing protein [Clostridiaceae bacterium]
MARTLGIDEIRQTVSALGAQYGAERIYLFGSYARGEAEPNSDVDLRIDKGSIYGLFALAGLKLAIEEQLETKVDLLTTDSLDRQFLDSIRSEEVLLYGNQ